MSRLVLVLKRLYRTFVCRWSQLEKGFLATELFLEVAEEPRKSEREKNDWRVRIAKLE